MRVFVFEHLVGGGVLHETLPAALAAQGGAMLTAAVRDLQRAGHDVVTTRDMRADLALAGAQCFTLMPGEDVNEAFERAAKQADAALVIAPETDGALAGWARRLDQLGVRSLGATVDAIELCADKLALHAHFVAHGIPTPATTREATELALPIVAKRRDGAGCEDARLLHDCADIHLLPGEPQRVFQPWQAGRAASVSLIAHDDGAQPLLAGEQFIETNDVLHYRGGRIPLAPVLADRATALAKRAVQSVRGLRGFVGVDLVLGDSAAQDVVIEINPRMTVSFVALAQLCEPALSEALLEPSTALQWQPATLRFDEFGRLAQEACP